MAVGYIMIPPSSYSAILCWNHTISSVPASSSTCDRRRSRTNIESPSDSPLSSNMPISKPVVTDYFVDIIPEMSKKLGILIETIQATTASCREVQRLVDTGNFGSNAGLLGEFTKSRVYHMNIIQSSTQIAHSDDSLIRGVTMALVAGTPLAGLLGDDPAEMIAEGLVGRMVAEDKLSVERARRKLELDQMMADGLQALSFNNAESSTSASRRRSTQPRTSRITSFWQFPTGDGKMARIADFVFAFI